MMGLTNYKNFEDIIDSEEVQILKRSDFKEKSLNRLERRCRDYEEIAIELAENPHRYLNKSGEKKYKICMISLYIVESGIYNYISIIKNKFFVNVNKYPKVEKAPIFKTEQFIDDYIYKLVDRHNYNLNNPKIL